MCKISKRTGDISINLGIDSSYINQKREKVIDENKLDRGALAKESWQTDPADPNVVIYGSYTEGKINADQVDNMELSTFNKLSNNSSSITTSTIYKFVESEELDKIESQIKTALPYLNVEKKGSELVINTTADEMFKLIGVKEKDGDDFKLIGVKDKDGDGKVNSSEFDQNMKIQEVKELAGNDLELTPDEALKYYLKNNTSIKADALKYNYEKLSISDQIINLLEDNGVTTQE